MPPKLSDERFWKKQQRRRDRRFGQPCCTQSGMSWSMIDMPGRFAVVIHGEFDCVNCFHHHRGRSSTQYYSTRLSEAQLTQGDTEEPLRRCLEGIARIESPEVVFVLGTCPVEVIGDPFHEVVEAVSAETGIPMIPLHTSGLKLSSQREMLDWLYHTLASLPPLPDADDPPPVQLIGFPGPRHRPLEPQLWCEELGQRLPSLPQSSTLSDWRQIRQARSSLVADDTAYPRLMQLLRESGQELVQLPMPYGLSASQRFYRCLDELGGLQGRLLQRAEPDRQRLEEAMESFRRRWEGCPVGLALRMRNTYQSDSVAYHGLGLLGPLRELGFELTLFVQGASEPEVLASWRERLREQGFEGEPRPFSSPYALSEELRGSTLRLIGVADQGRQAAQEAGIPSFEPGEFLPYLGGALQTLTLLEQRLKRGRA